MYLSSNEFVLPKQTSNSCDSFNSRKPSNRLSFRAVRRFLYTMHERRDTVFTEQQEKAIKAIADGADNKLAAEISGLGEKYIASLKSQAEFSHALALCCVDRLKGLLPDSITKLGEIIRAKDKDLYPTQVQAVKTVLEYSRIADLAQTVPENVTVTIKYE